MNTLKDIFALYFKGLRAALTTTLPASKERIALFDVLWAYVLRLSGRIDRLVTRWKNGTLPKPRATRAGRTRTTPRGKPKFRLPRGHMWLIRSIQGTAFAGSQLRHLIATSAELHEFLEAAPQGRRLLNPLLRMLGIDFDKPYGVPLVKPLGEPKPEPQAAAEPPAEPPRPAESASPSAKPAPNPPLVFSSA